MKKEIPRIFVLLFFMPAVAQAQLFTKITNAPQVNASSDSRSVNFVDVNNDGWEDLFITNGPEAGAKNFLYLNDGTGNFTAVTTGDIVSHSQPFDGATFADFDNDGNLDAFAVTWYGRKNYLYRGNGDGTFAYLPTAAPSLPGTYSETASWGDYDRDGDVDLYVTNSEGSFRNLLYRNDGGQSFTQVNNAGAAVTDAKASRSVNWVDYDSDGFPDLFVSNEGGQEDDLYKNNGNGTFSKITAGAPGKGSLSSMSSSWGDVDNDGDFDVFIANSGFYEEQDNQLYLNQNGVFTAVTTGALVTDGGCSYGSNFGDYDNDGDLDLIVANGFCNSNLVNFLYQNDGRGNFSRDYASIGDLSTPASYGAAWGDVNNDGFLDLAVATCKNTSASPLPKNLFFLNNGNANRWVKIKLTGRDSNRSAIGAKVWVTAAINGQPVTQLREISAQSGYCGQNSLIAHFGLGNSNNVSEVRVRFPGGKDTLLTNLATNQLHEITEAGSPSAVHFVEKERLSAKITPNPVFDTFKVELHFPTPVDEVQLRLTDTIGRLIFEKTVPTKGATQLTEVFSKSGLGLSEGAYLLTISSNHRSIWDQKVIIK